MQVSKEKVIIDGAFFYLHTVKEKQTFFSICQAYAIATEKVLLANPGLIPEALSIGQVIKIPFINEVVKEQVRETPDFYYHTVEKGQTLLQVQRQYGVGVDIIKQHNPDIYGDIINVGQVLKIPKQKMPVVVEESVDSLYKHYYVKPGDRLFRIAKQFNIRVADIVEINKGLRWGLKPGERILIPKDKYALYEPEYKQDTTVLLGTPVLSISQCDSLRRQSSISQINVAVFLPFGIIQDVTYDSLIIHRKDTIVETYTKQVTRYSDGIIEFYEGILLAVDSIRKSGINIEVKAFNINGDSNQTKAYLSGLDAYNPNLIIGPVKEDNIKRVAAYAKKKGVLHILPFSDNVNYLLDHPTGFQLMPPAEYLNKQKAKFLAGLHNANVIYIGKNDSATYQRVALFDSLVNYYKGLLQTDSLITAFIPYDDNTSKYLYDTMRVSKMNMVVPFFDDRKEREESEVITVYSMFYPMRDRYPISIMGNYNWQTFNNKRIEPYHDFKTHLISPFYIDYREPETIQFAEFCKNRLSYEPFRMVSNGTGFNFAYLGFESAMLFVNAFKDYGNQIPGCSSYLFGAARQSNYRFKQVEGGLGFYNASYTLLLFDNDYNVKILKKE